MIVPLGNVIAPLLFPLGIQLLVGNVLIAAVETRAVRRWFTFRRRGLGWLVLLANYVSAILGVIVLLVLTGLVAPLLLGDQLIAHAWRVAVFIAVAALVLSILIEWPFFHMALEPQARRATRSFRACGIAQLVSYAMLLPLYAYFATNTLGKWTLASPREVASDSTATLLYLSCADGELYAKPLKGGIEHRLAHPPLSRPITGSDSLQLTAGPDGHHVELRLRRWDDSSQLLGEFPATPEIHYRYEEDQCGGGDPNFNEMDLRPKDQRQRDFYASPYGGGLTEMIRRSEYNYDFKRLVALDLLFLSWPARCATLLPGDQVVFQLSDQIVLADVNARRMAVLAHGQSPTVAIAIDPQTFVAHGSATQAPALGK